MGSLVGDPLLFLFSLVCLKLFWSWTGKTFWLFMRHVSPGWTSESMRRKKIIVWMDSGQGNSVVVEKDLHVPL